jgi:hypothetical protein
MRNEYDHFTHVKLASTERFPHGVYVLFDQKSGEVSDKFYFLPDRAAYKLGQWANAYINADELRDLKLGGMVPLKRKRL